MLWVKLEMLLLTSNRYVDETLQLLLQLNVAVVLLSLLLLLML